MNSKVRSTGMTALATGLLIGGAALTTLTTTGCDRLATEQAAALTVGSDGAAADTLAAVEKPDLRSKLAANHNETFLAAPTV